MFTLPDWGIKSALSFLNLFSVCISRLWVGFLGLFANPDIYDYQIHKEEESYNRMRYSRQDGDYRKINERGCEFVYKIMRYDHIWTAFLIDVSPKSSRNFNKALQYLIKHQGKEFDLILYIGVYLLYIQVLFVYLKGLSLNDLILWGVYWILKVLITLFGIYIFGILICQITIYYENSDV